MANRYKSHCELVNIVKGPFDLHTCWPRFRSQHRKFVIKYPFLYIHFFSLCPVYPKASLRFKLRFFSNGQFSDKFFINFFTSVTNNVHCMKKTFISRDYQYFFLILKLLPQHTGNEQSLRFSAMRKPNLRGCTILIMLRHKLYRYIISLKWRGGVQFLADAHGSGLHIVENRRLCSFSVCCGKNYW